MRGRQDYVKRQRTGDGREQEREYEQQEDGAGGRV